MTELPPTLIALSALIIFLLGCVHLWFTFHGNQLHPRDPELLEKLKLSHPKITRETTMWNAWIGFNASHSYGAMLFGLVYGYLALAHAQFLFDSKFLLLLGLVLLGGYVFLGKCYWFSRPFYGITLATVLYSAALIVYWGG